MAEDYPTIDCTRPEAMSDNIEKLRQIGDSLIDPDFAAQLFEDGYPDAIVVVNENGVVKLINRHMELMFGYHRSEVYDKPIEMFVPDAARTRHEVHRAKYIAEPRTRPMGLGMILQGRHKTGTEFDVEISLSPIIAKQGYFTVATIRKRRANGTGS